MNNNFNLIAKSSTKSELETNAKRQKNDVFREIALIQNKSEKCV